MITITMHINGCDCILRYCLWKKESLIKIFETNYVFGPERSRTTQQCTFIDTLFSIKERISKDIFLSCLTHFPTFIPWRIRTVLRRTVNTFWVTMVICDKVLFEAQIIRNKFDPKVILYNYVSYWGLHWIFYLPWDASDIYRFLTLHMLKTHFLLENL